MKKKQNSNKYLQNNSKIMALLGTAMCLLFFLSFCYLWAQSNFGNIGMEEIVFHLNMPLKGTPGDLFLDFFLKVICMTIFFTAIAVYSLSIIKSFRKNIVQFLGISFVLLFTWFVLLLNAANDTFGLMDYIERKSQASLFIEEHYVNPNDVDIIFPENKRNLICIYVESAETSLQNKSSGGLLNVNLIPEMTKIAHENVSFSESDLFKGACVTPYTSWTMAALVAETSGTPLKLAHHLMNNTMGQYESFLPGVTSLGELLAEEGYHNYFMVGSDFDFGGRTDYFTQHGNYEIFDYYTAIERGKIPSDYHRWWGFEDKKLYAFAKEELLELATKEQPFNFSMLTVDTHHENGYICDECVNLWDNQYANVWSCASKQLDDFIKWIQQQEFYENTTVVILGDHCSMDADFYENILGDRRVYNAFVNSAIEPTYERNRLFTTMDMFPTILAAIGVEIEGERLGLGTNLFSIKKTLSEEFGTDYIFTELQKVSIFYNEELLFP